MMIVVIFAAGYLPQWGYKYNSNDHYLFSGLFATVRKCTHRETGVEYAAKYSSRLVASVIVRNKFQSSLFVILNHQSVFGV